ARRLLLCDVLHNNDDRRELAGFEDRGAADESVEGRAVCRRHGNVALPIAARMCGEYRRSGISANYGLERFADNIAEEPGSCLIHVSDLSFGTRDEDCIGDLRDRLKFRVMCSNGTIK